MRYRPLNVTAVRNWGLNISDLRRPDWKRRIVLKWGGGIHQLHSNESKEKETDDAWACQKPSTIKRLMET